MSLLVAQDLNTPRPIEMTPPADESTNTAPILIDSHPTANQPGPGDQPTLSLHPPAATEVVIPEPTAPGAEVTPEHFNLINPAMQAEDLANHLLVVYNQNDFNSRTLADYYASKRNIPAERVFPIACSMAEEINRAEFEKTIREPIFYYLLKKNWMTRRSVDTQIGTRAIKLLVASRNDIWAIVLIRGVPLKVAPDPSDDDSMQREAALQTNAASVDSELAMLPIFGFPKGGFVPNVFFDVKGNGMHRVGPELAKNIILVSRLDGPTPQQVRRMIDDSLEAEKNRLAGLAVVDTRGINDSNSSFYSGDLWLRNSRALLVHDGWTVRFDDSPDVLPATAPFNRVALYLGWYNDRAVGPWVTWPDRFVPGAVAYHLHSFSAVTVRDETQNWVGPLIAHGADATMGTVYEPYLALTPHEDIFTKRLLTGNYFAEAAYASIPGLSWMVTVVGDPLYRPFRVPLEDALALAKTPHTTHDDWLLLQQVQQQLVAGHIDAKVDQLQESLDVLGAGPVAQEYLGDLLTKLNEPRAANAVDQAYKKASAMYSLPMDRIRVGIKLAGYYSSHNQEYRSKAQLNMLRQQYPNEAIQFGLAPPVATASPPPAKKAPPTTDLGRAPTPPKPPKPPVP